MLDCVNAIHPAKLSYYIFIYQNSLFLAMSNGLTIRVSRKDIRLAIEAAMIDIMASETPTEQQIDRCIEWLKKDYDEELEDKITEFVTMWDRNGSS